ncbi:MAG TPA: hypothetical protein VKY59_08580 [Spirillospora sp.]|nr:hypothetical protein [Spirillospora sp.]
MKHSWFWIIGLVLVFTISGVGLAQDEEPPTLPAEGEAPPVEGEPTLPAEGEIPPAVDAPPVEEVQGEVTLGAITADSPSYYGQEVVIDGVLSEFLNARTFILSEGAVLFNSAVLVINTSPDEFDLSVVAGERVQVGGVVLPSFEEGGFDQIQMDEMAGFADSQLNFTPLADIVAERFANYTIIQVTSAANVMLLPEATSQ